MSSALYRDITEKINLLETADRERLLAQLIHIVIYDGNERTSDEAAWMETAARRAEELDSNPAMGVALGTIQQHVDALLNQ